MRTNALFYYESSKQMRIRLDSTTDIQVINIDLIKQTTIVLGKDTTLPYGGNWQFWKNIIKPK